ncbi:Putative amidohydrolase ytcJ [Gossypium arboreum]|uniref:Uncharacterized protein n=2 Tax=Gossypium arboreum TaxID=29729 RepID=A0ABR0PQT6_GOSAR|nr:protein LONG AFTER FAR-RED 3 [Gossypium arboreum]KAK5826676.1 hypothetical protein PVK06_021602 [Gossypium arboreum]KHG08815.1 Putative amidohydrolase ytcJ [Gossypium arboreum]
MNLSIVISASIAIFLSVFFFPLFNSTYWLKWRASLVPSTKFGADLIVKNGVIFTSDPSFPFANSMAIRDGRILRIGNYSSLQDLSGYGTKELNLEGKVVVPGFIDSHVHLISAGLQMARVQVEGVNRKDEIVRRVKEAVLNAKRGSWILGGGWNNDLWGGELPMASWVDEVTPDNPVWLTRMDGHMGLANSVALKLAGVTNLTKDPNGGTIMQTADGEPTGLLIDAAMELILSWIPEVSMDERREAMLRASSFALTRGVTTVVDVGRYFPGSSVEHSWQDFSDVYQWADSSGKMKIRVCLFFPIETWSRLYGVIHRAGRALSNWIYLGGVKAFADGSLGSNSALFHEPYFDDPHNYGLQVVEFESLFNMTIASDMSGLQVAIHAIGDKATDLILDMYESVALKNGKRDRRFRIEHAQHLAPGTADRFGQQGIVASVQPDHLLDDADVAIRKLGVDRAQKGSYLFRSLLSSNALLALGSDWPVTSTYPLRAIRTAMNRIPPGWDTAWIPSERLSLNDALIAHTISAARACFRENEIGSLLTGKLADFVILSSDSWDEFATGGSTSVNATYVGGIQAYP